MGGFGDAGLKQAFLGALATKFSISNKGQLQYYLGLNCRVADGQASLDQAKYIGELLTKFGLQGVYPATTPMLSRPMEVEPTLGVEEHATFRRMVGCLVYIMIMTRPDIAYSVSCV